MARTDLSSLDPMRFLSIMPERAAVVAAAAPKSYSAHRVNALAEALHPASQHLKVSHVTVHSQDAKTYTLVADSEMGTSSLAYFDAGQYLSFSFEKDGKYTTRPYSIVSSPADALRGFYRITVKRVTGGEISGHILDTWEEGTKAVASAPLGNFTYEPLRDCKSILAICGGSGITPILSLAKAVSEGTEDCSLTILYGAKYESELLHKEELDELTASSDRIKAVYVLSGEVKNGYESGFISRDIIEKHKPEELFSVFICGPEAMYSYLEEELTPLGLERKYIRREVQGEMLCPEKHSDHPGNAPEKVTVTIKQGNASFTVEGSGNETVLRILERSIACPPSHCRSGECGFCRSRLVSGEIFIPKASDRRRLADEPHGYIHPCCSYPLSDLEIEISSEI
ncbi:MAG: 2Fe-2S iron-sulfur cluster binding domain-containing protein [Clostridia bacterium]|nr:2Fe-2S iron-sulfur cluster binding domain-containing protein [Clostridia bacterium]